MISPNKVNGILSQEEARIIQLQKYELDMKKHAEKEKQKLDKKKAEKWKRYNHIDMGEKLPNIGQAETIARNQQQSVHDEKVMNYILKLERENARMRAEEEKRRESSLAGACSSTISNINHSQTQSPRPYVERIPFEANSVTNSSSLGSSNVSSPTTSVNREFFGGNSANFQAQNSSTTNVVDSPKSQDKAESEKIKQEMYKRDMETVRDKMQKLYSQQLNTNE